MNTEQEKQFKSRSIRIIDPGPIPTTGISTATSRKLLTRHGAWWLFGIAALLVILTIFFGQRFLSDGSTAVSAAHTETLTLNSPPDTNTPPTEGDRSVADRSHSSFGKKKGEILPEKAAEESATEKQEKELPHTETDDYQRALTQGEAAWSQRDFTEAARQFAWALALKGNDPKAQAGLAKSNAGAKAEVAYLSADSKARTGNLAGATADYQQALAYVADHEKAKQGLARVSKALFGKRLKEDMAKILHAIERKNFSEAKERLSRAKKMAPGSAALRELAERLQKETVALEIVKGQKRALAFEREERWEEAKKEYAGILSHDKTLALARTGTKRAEEHIALYRMADHYLADPKRVYVNSGRTAVATLIATIKPRAAMLPKLGERLSGLGKLLDLANTPLSVTLTSDDKTTVIIQKIGNQEHFTRKTISLLPGHYVLLGQRNGYRDVRKEVWVLPGAEHSWPVITHEAFR